MPDPTTSPPTSEYAKTDPEALAFLRRRVGAYGAVLGVIGVAGILVRVVMAIFFGYGDQLKDDPSLLPHAVGAVAFMLVYPATRFGPANWSYLVAVEAIGMIVGSYAYIWMGTTIPIIAHPVLIVYGVLSLGFFARAIYVPSPPRRTLLLGVLIGVPFAGKMYLHALEDIPNPEWIRAIENIGLGQVNTGELALNAPIEATVWWLFSVVVATLASHVIYGLRREMRNVKRLGQYTLEKKIGEGGMGVVYRASHAMLRRPTAVKLLPPEKAGQRSLKRFEREVRLTALLTHSNTVTIFDYGRTPDNVFYYAMELLDGATLQDIVEVDGAQPPSRIVHIIDQAAAALTEAHDVGLIHRDIKPANIMLCTQGGDHDVAKVCDFGLVKELDRDTSVSLSQMNVIAGTPQYISPEAITHPDAIDGRADIYALGAVLFFLLTGEHVFPGATVVEVCSHHLHSTPDAPSARLGESLPEGLDELVLDCLAKKPEGRPESAREFRRRLRALEVAGWSEDDAYAWWAENREAVDHRVQDRSKSTSGGTVMIDLEKR